MEIRPLTEAELLKLMRQSCNSRAVSDEDLLALIRAVEGHTLMADLMAKTLAESWGGVTARGILDALKNSELDQEDFPEVVADRNREERQRKLYAHLKALFDLSGMSEEDRSILRCATLLPEDGMRDRLFMDCLPREQRQPLRNLTKRGWLHHEGENLTIHPVIREVCREELEPTDETCEDFIAQLYNRHDISRIYDADRFLEMAKCFSIASERLTDTMGNYAFYASLFWHKLGLTQKAQQFELRAVEQRERNLPPDSEGLAVTYNNMAMVCCALGNQDMALQYQKRMLAICEKQFSVDHPVVAISYNNLGYIYSAQGDYLKALEYHLKAQAIYEKALPEYIIWLAVSYGNVGMTYCLLGSPGKGLEYNLKALAILEKEGVSDHPDFAKALNNVGFAYGLLGKHDKAMEYYRKAVEIGERLLPTDHSELANYYYNVGVTYFELGECCRAMEYLEKALAIYEKSLPPDHPYIASTKESIGNVRSRL